MKYYHRARLIRAITGSIRFINQHLSTVLLIVVLLVTICNKFLISDFLLQWKIIMITLAFCLTIFSISRYFNTRTKPDLILVIYFFTELVATIKGWNLSTEYYTEFILLLLFIGTYYLIKQWVK